MNTKDQWFLKIILPALGRLDFYGFHHGFSIVITPPKAGWIFIVFTTEPQQFSTRVLNKFYIIIYIFLCMEIIQYQWFLKIIHAVWGEFYHIFIADSWL